MLFHKIVVNLMKRHITVLQKTSLANCVNKRRFSSHPQPTTLRQVQSINRKSVKTNKDGPIALFLMLIPLTTFGLGTWQVKRKKWKEELIESLLEKTKFPAVPLPESDDEILSMEYRKVHVKGEFEHSKEMYLGPRSLLLQGESAYHGKLLKTTSNNASGYLVITPFILSDTKERILVNRGWVSFQQKNPGTRRQGQILGEIELEGVIRLTEPKRNYGPLNKLDARVWLSRDVEEMAKFIDCRPVFIDATADSTIAGGPIGGQTRTTLRNEHFSYILTWYGLSLCTAIMWYSKFGK